MSGMMHEDRYGLPLSTASSAAASAYRDGIDRMLSAWTGAAEAFERAIADDPDFALAHIARARIHSFYQQGERGAEGSRGGARSGRSAAAPSARRAMSRRWRSPSKASCRRRCHRR